jgi:hypothetical protein
MTLLTLVVFACMRVMAFVPVFMFVRHFSISSLPEPYANVRAAIHLYLFIAISDHRPRSRHRLAAVLRPGALNTDSEIESSSAKGVKSKTEGNQT